MALIVASVAVLAAAVASFAAIRAASPRPPSELTAVPAQGTSGSMLSLTGSLLPARTLGTVSLGGIRLARIWVDGRGEWSGRVRVPRHMAARQTLLRLAVGRRVIVGRFAVTKSASAGSPRTSFAALSSGEWVRLSPTLVGAGSSIRLEATGFHSRAPVEVWLGAVRLATWRASRSGALEGSVPIPGSTRGATQTLSVRSGSHRLDLRVVITAGPAPQSGSPGQLPAFTGASPPLAASEGAAYTYTFAASGIPAPTYALAAGAPSWLSIDPQSGHLSGTAPTGSAGTSVTYSVTATNSEGSASAGPFTVKIVSTPVFTAASPPLSATEGVRYSYTFAAASSPAATFALAAGAPSWLSIDPQSGMVSGTPPTGSAGTSVSYSVTAANPRGAVSAGPFTIKIGAPPTINPIPDQSAAQQAPITPVAPSTTGQVSGFSATGLPPGLAIDAGSGVISGAALKTGTYQSTVTVTGPGGAASTTFSWTVSDPIVDAVGDMACAADDSNYNNGNGEPGVAAPWDNCLQRYVSDLVVNRLPSGLLDLGDNQYNTGALGDYENVFGTTFGRANAVTYPTPGNAEYNNGDSPPSGFFSYFSMTGVFSRIENSGGGDTSHLTSDGYYSFNIGTWHIIALNSNCTGTYSVSGGCAAGSPEELWLKSDLAQNTQKCILAYWHHPRWNSGTLGNDSTTAAFWTDLYNAHATLVLNGHGNHHYERFTPQDPNGNPTSTGIREFIVSTGGQSHGLPPSSPGDAATSEVTNYDTFGILKLTLHPSSYDWQFVPASDGQPGHFTDSGSGSCA